MKKELIEAWRTNNLINLMLIDRIVPEGMKATLSKRGGRGVARVPLAACQPVRRQVACSTGIQTRGERHEPSRGPSWRDQQLEGGKVLEIQVAVGVHVERRQMGIQALWGRNIR